MGDAPGRCRIGGPGPGPGPGGATSSGSAGCRLAESGRASPARGPPGAALPIPHSPLPRLGRGLQVKHHCGTTPGLRSGPPLAAARPCVAQAAPPGRRTCGRGFDRASTPNLPGRSPPTEVCWLQRRASLATAGRTPAAAAPRRRGLRCVSFSRQLVYSLYRDYGKNAETRGSASARKKAPGRRPSK